MLIRIKGFNEKSTCAIIKRTLELKYVTMHVERYMHALSRCNKQKVNTEGQKIYI